MGLVNQVLDMQNMYNNAGNQPYVAIFMITYNHAEFIQQAIESVMMQETTFGFKLYVGEDCSTDNTRPICKQLKGQYPDKIELYLHDKNLGATQNAMIIFEKCFKSGAKYIAMLEGDDYWTDPLKLQKQTSFLDENPDFSICVHHVNILGDGILQNSNSLKYPDGITFTIDDLAKGNLFYTPSVVFRNGNIEHLPSWYNLSPVGDYVLHMLNARKGKIKHLPDTMAVYRQHGGGLWSAQTRAAMLEKWMRVLSFLLTEEFTESVVDLLEAQKKDTCDQYLTILLENHDSLKSNLNELPEPGKQLLFDLLIREHLELKEIKNKYYNLKNSRLRKYLSFIFKQLKM